MITKDIFKKGSIAIILLLIFSLIAGCSSSSPDISEDLNYNVTFTVVDEGEDPVEGASVDLDGTVKTTDNGVVTFSKPDGSYDYNITLTGYDTIYDTAVVNGENLSISKTLTQSQPDEYNINFTVTDTADTPTPIGGATVTLDEVDKTTDGSGMVTFSKPNGTYNYTVTADGYIDKTDTVIVDGDDITVDVTLEIPEAPVYNVSFTIVDASDNPIEGAVVSLDSISDSTDSNGQVIFQKENGTYSYSVSKTGYVEVSESFVVNDSDIPLDITLNLAPPEGYIGIYDWEDLDNVRNDLTIDYILMNNLDSTTPGYDTYASINANSGEGWQPIGNSSTPFRGTFDGNNLIISNLYINRSSESYAGLFGYMNSTVKDLGLEQVDITGHDYVGALTGDLYGDSYTIENCYSTGSITGHSYVGGLIGENEQATITGCYSLANVAGTYMAIGGLVGNNKFAEIYESYASGTVSGDIVVGGLVGSISASTIERNYASGDVSGNGSHRTQIGGLIGSNAGSSYIKNTYATGDVTGDSRVGGLIGYMPYGKLYYSYSIGNVTGNSKVGGLVGENGSAIYDSICLDRASYGIIGDNYYTSGRVTEAPQEDMQKDDIYTEITLTGYADMDVIWDSSIWNFGTETDPDYPTLYWE